MEKDNNQPQVDITAEVAAGVYSNLAMVSHSPTDFVSDFMCILPGMPRPMVRTRVIMAPENAKRLMLALTENIQKYEEMFGEIELNAAPAKAPASAVAPFKLPKA